MTSGGLTRRQFAQCLLVAGVGVAFVGCGRAKPQTPLSTHWWLELHPDGRIRMLTAKVEVGQGVHTGFRTLIAEELDVDPEAIEIVQVPSDPAYGEILTGGSFSLFAWSNRLRRAAAAARHLIVHAAAAEWRAPVEELTTQEGQVVHAARDRRAPYREFLAGAALLEPPADDAIVLKPQAEWRLIGKRGPIAWHRDIVQGRAKYGIDFRLPNLRFAVLARAPTLGARLASFDDAAARNVPGFIAAVPLRGNAWPSSDHCRDAVAVVAENSWAAQKAREMLRIEWTPSPRPALGSSEMFAKLHELCEVPGIVSYSSGEQPSPNVTATLEATYQQAWLAHAPLEPPNATARFRDGRMEVWTGTQRQTRLKDAIVRELELRPEDVVVHAALIGGSFGRRLDVDYGFEAARLAKQVGYPIQVLWTREDDLRFAVYRSGSVHRLSATLDRAGKLERFAHRYAADSVLSQQEPQNLGPDRADWTLAAPLVAFLYESPALQLEHRISEPMTPCTWWRGTYWTSVTTANECFIDELAQASNQDPLAFRLAHLASDAKREFVASKEVTIPFHPARLRGVLNAAAERAGWASKPAQGHARGLACGIYDSPECHAAVIAEMALRDGAPTLTRAIVAVDVGTVVNPSVVEAQAISGFVMGASAVLREQITWRDGQVQQSNFQDYPPLRMSECPPVEVIIVPSDSGMCGVGEIVTPAAMAAVVNAASRLTGRRIQRLPINA